ncbi:BLOC-1-related complex subunit 8-like [Glandiceps talaboti]
MVDIGSHILAGIEASRRDMDADLDYKVKKVTEKFSESLHIVANEPSLALYRLQEHVRKTLPVLSDKRNEMKGLQQEIQGMCYDAEYASNAVKRMQGSGQYFSSIDEHIKKAIYLKQELSKTKSTKSANTSIPTPHQPLSSANSSPAHQVSSTQGTPEHTAIVAAATVQSKSDRESESGDKSATPI